MPIQYPTLMVEDSGYAALLQGHNLPLDVIEAAEAAMLGEAPEGWFRETQEVHFAWVPRVKWCSRHPFSGGWSCDQEGFFHGHWFEVRESADPTKHFTIVRHTDQEPDA